LIELTSEEELRSIEEVLSATSRYHGARKHSITSHIGKNHLKLWWCGVYVGNMYSLYKLCVA